MTKQKSLIKERLEKYTELLAEIEIEERRKNALKDDGTMNYKRAKAGIYDNLKRLLDQEQEEYEELIAVINALPCVDQRQVMLARYMDGQGWNTITAVVFGERPDYKEKIESYTRRIYRIHGNALVNADKILTENMQNH